MPQLALHCRENLLGISQEWTITNEGILIKYKYVIFTIVGEMFDQQSMRRWPFKYLCIDRAAEFGSNDHETAQ